MVFLGFLCRRGGKTPTIEHGDYGGHCLGCVPCVLRGLTDLVIDRILRQPKAVNRTRHPAPGALALDEKLLLIVYLACLLSKARDEQSTTEYGYTRPPY